MNIEKPLILGGDIKTLEEKQRKKFNFAPDKAYLPQSLISILANVEQNHDIFGIIEELQPIIETAAKNQSKRPLNKIYIFFNNIVQRNFYDREMAPIELKPIFAHLSQQKIDLRNNFEGCCEILKVIGKSFFSVSEEDPDDDDEDNTEDGEEEEEETKEERKKRDFLKLAKKSLKLSNTLKSISLGKLSKFLNLKVNHSSEYYSTIENMKFVLHLCLDLPIESVKFTTPELLQLYLGLPLAALVNKKRKIFLAKYSPDDEEDNESEEDEDEEEDEEDEDEEEEDDDDEEIDDDEDQEETEEKGLEESKGNDNKRNVEFKAPEVKKNLDKWFNLLVALVKILSKKDLDDLENKTYDKDHDQIRTYECNNLKWTYVPLGDNFDVTLVKMKDQCEVSLRSYGVSIVRDVTMYQFEYVQISSYNNSKALDYNTLKDRLNKYLNTPEDNYIIARAYSTKSAVFENQTSYFNEEFINDIICFYSINTNDLAEIKKGTKDYLFIRITDTYLFVVVLDLTQTLNQQINLITSRFSRHNIQFSAEELKQKLLWDDKAINWECKFSYFLDLKETCNFAKTGVMFTFNGTEADKPVYKNERYPHSINLKMDVSNIMTHFYRNNMEDYNKQQFDLNTMAPSVIGFEISDFSSKFDFCNNFNVTLKDFDDENEDVTKEYRVFSVVLKKSERNKKDKVFLYNELQGNFKGLEAEEEISLEEMKQKFVSMVYFVRKKDNRGEDRMEMI